MAAIGAGRIDIDRSPWRCTIALNTPSAVGERQMLPVQTKRTPVLMFFLSTRITRRAAFVNPISRQGDNPAQARNAGRGAGDTRQKGKRMTAIDLPSPGRTLDCAHAERSPSRPWRALHRPRRPRPELLCRGRQFQDVLSLYLDAGWRTQMTPHFERLGELAGGRIDELASIADKHPPVLHPRDRFGRDEDWIEYHPAYREMEKIAFGDFGMHAMSHRPGVLGMNETAPPLVKYAFTYLLVQAEFGLMCPISVSDTSNFIIKRYGSAPAEEAAARPAAEPGSGDHAEGHAVHDREGRRLGCRRGRDRGRADGQERRRRGALEAAWPEMVLLATPTPMSRCCWRGRAARRRARRGSACSPCRAASRTARATATGSCG